ncbi:hypothetical protein [Rubellimicrobium arenae]|uniref:hypothetical protein n=1 Tax=Rubellimicrobium arenae TaxID=2817372 RepID=UPI001B313DAC|nr:hypothetical protein [Rubellimicrobium arenae]
MAFLRPLVLFALFLVVLYAVLSVWLRLRERRRLSREWRNGDQLVDEDIFVDEGMAAYDHSLRKRLLWLVIVGPMAGLLVLLYVLNVS